MAPEPLTPENTTSSLVDYAVGFAKPAALATTLASNPQQR